MRLSVSVLSAASLAVAALSTTAPPAFAAPTASAPRTVTAHDAPVAAPPGLGGLVMVQALPQSAFLPPKANQDIADFDARLAELESQFTEVADTETDLQTREEDLNTAIDKANDEATSISEKVDQHNAEVDDLQAQIDAHNAKPNTFRLPDQEAAAAAYQAEADRLNAEKDALNAEEDSIQAEQTKLDGEQNGLDSRKEQLLTDIDNFTTTLETLESGEQQLEADRLNLLQEVSSALDDLAAQVSASSGESSGANEVAQGGDAAAPADQPAPDGLAVPAAQSAPASQPDPAVDQTAGGDMPSAAGQNSALEAYAQQHGVSVEEQPVTVRLSPQTLTSLPANQAAQIGLTNTYQGVVREPSGNYRAVEVVSPGSGFGPAEQAFNDAIARGGRADAVIDGRPAVIDAVDTYVDPDLGTEPAPDGDGQSTPAPSPSQEEKPKNCTDRKPAGAQTLPNGGWVRYLPPSAPNGRARGMMACLFGYDSGAGTNPQVDPAGWAGALARATVLVASAPDVSPHDKKNPLARCHFLAARFGGSNTDRLNFTSCWQYPVNVGLAGMSAVEDNVAYGLKKGMYVDFREYALYNSPTSDTPSRYTTIVYGQAPGSDVLIPFGSPPIANSKTVNGVPVNIGN